MKRQLQSPDGFQCGDKVRIRAGPNAKIKGVICAEANGYLEITLENNNTIHVMPAEIINYSLAARRAWKTMSKHSSSAQE